jgi:hypothetical protein
MATTTNRLKEQASNQALINGLTKHAATIPLILVGGQSLTNTQMVATLQGRLAHANAALSTRAAWQSAVKADQDDRTKTGALISGLRKVVSVAFAGEIDTLADFGLIPPKKHVISPEKKAAAALKGKATRAARHTLGKNQRKAITGTTPAPAQPVTTLGFPATPPSAALPTRPQPAVTSPWQPAQLPPPTHGPAAVT